MDQMSQSREDAHSLASLFTQFTDVFAKYKVRLSMLTPRNKAYVPSSFNDMRVDC